MATVSAINSKCVSQRRQKYQHQGTYSISSIFNFPAFPTVFASCIRLDLRLFDNLLKAHFHLISISDISFSFRKLLQSSSNHYLCFPLTFPNEKMAI